MEKEIIVVQGEVHEIDVRPITLIFKNANVGDVTYPNRIVLDPQTTVTHANAMTTVMHPIVWQLFKMAFKEYSGDTTPAAVRKVEHKGMLHVLGLLDLSLQCMLADVQFVWQYPETYLHPSIQVELADIIIAMQNIVIKRRNDEREAGSDQFLDSL